MKIWVRLGITMDISEQDYEVLRGDDRDAANDRFKQLIFERKFTPDGESYIPAGAEYEDIEFYI